MMPHLAPHSRHTRRTISAGVSVKAPGFPPVRMALVSLPAPPRSLGLNAWKLVMTILAAGTCLAGQTVMAQGLTSSNTHKSSWAHVVTYHCHLTILGKNGGWMLYKRLYRPAKQV